ncbi:MAG TPA: hypothetical protein VFZ21_11725 [Gemmatimonadaceae bacterium]|jgi:hypothetical protein|nr:hypothetical protein [Gemmatimonadaceae bacterium]
MRLLRTAAVAVVILLPGSLAAQKLTPGTWTGTISPPSGETFDATFEVRASGDTTKITLKAAPGTFEASDVKVEADRVLFTWSPGNATVKCTLLLRDDKKSYSGNCVDASGRPGVIVMTPPKAQ